MRDQLVGYLLGALEPAEHEEVESRLFTDVELQRDLADLRRKLALLDDGDEFEPPGGLAARTCNYVRARAPAFQNAAHPAAKGSAPSAAPLPAPVGGWRVQDMIVGGGIFLAACMLLFPAIANSLSHARMMACQNNLRTIGVALGQYSDYYGGFFPVVPQQGPLAVAGSYGPTLADLKLIEGPTLLLCPAVGVADDGTPFTVPTIARVINAPAADLPRLQAVMGGSYGYTFGYTQGGQYQGHRNHGRANFALMADAPGEAPGGLSANHGGAGQNVLFEDLHVVFLKHCQLSGCGDHIYVNGHGYVGAGIGPNDAVIGRSSARPVTFQVVPGE